MQAQFTFKFKNDETFTTPLPNLEDWEELTLEDHVTHPDWDRYYVQDSTNKGAIFCVSIKHAVDGSHFSVPFVTEESKCFLSDFIDRMIDENAIVENLKLFTYKGKDTDNG